MWLSSSHVNQSGPDEEAAARIAKAIAGYPIVTCDIFDTAVMRRLARPDDVHLATGARALAAGLTACRAEAFREYRIAAEAALRAEQDPDCDGEIAIARVYLRLQESGVVTDAAAAASLEGDTERSVCRPVPAVLAALTARDPSQRLIFLSDTMLPRTWLAAILSACGYGDDLEVVCSAEADCTKAHGGLFLHLLRTLGCQPRDVIHLGDNPLSDVENARRRGIAALHLPSPPSPPEQEDVASWCYVMRLAHSARRSRVAATAAASQPGPGGALADQRLLRIALGPLIGLTLFALAEARRRGIRRIYFMSRDGHLPLAIARKLLARQDQSVELAYLPCSRQAILLPSLVDDLPKLAWTLADNTLGRPLRVVLNALGIAPQTTTGLAQQAGLAPDQPISGQEGHDAVRRLIEFHRALVVLTLRQRREAALAYLEEAGFLAPGPRMVVDVGWRGSVQKALARLTGAAPTDIFGAYLGLWPDALCAELGPFNAAGYLFSFGHPKANADLVRQGYILFELYFSAPHGPVSHYIREDGRMAPVFAAEPEREAIVRHQAIAAIAENNLAAFDELDAIIDGAWPETIDPHSALSEMIPLLARPSAGDVAAINRVPFVHGVDSTVSSRPVNPVSLRQMLLHPTAATRRISYAPWQGGTLRASLPWPVPDMSFPEFSDRVHRLRRFLHLD